MQYAKLGWSSLKISRIALGGMSYGSKEPWMAQKESALRIIKKGFDLGINFIDTADVYSNGESEKIIGEAIRGYNREEIIIGSKVGLEFGNGINNSGLSRKRLYTQLSGSLQRLNTEYIDIYQIHRWDYYTDIEETLSTLSQFINEGKVRYLGATSIYAFQIQRLWDLAIYKGYEKLVYYSPRYNLAYREEERESIPLCRELNIAIAPYSPLARGFLTGKYKRDQTPNTVRYLTDKYLPTGYFKPEDFDVVENLEEMAKQKGIKPAVLALAWLFNKPYITTVLLGATKPEHLDDAVQALEIKLTEEEMKLLEKPYRPHELMGPTKSPLVP